MLLLIKIMFKGWVFGYDKKNIWDGSAKRSKKEQV